MINYHRLESHGGGPRDVILTTDDNDAEMTQLAEMIKQCEFEIELPKDREQDGKFHIKIPGEMVGEFSECVWDVDNGKLENLTEKWNQEMLSELDDDA
jgi:hypothetical protein